MRLLHELEVHQAELESQNEELRRARREVEAALARFTDLFDFAPIGYAIVDAGDAIRAINHAGASMFDGFSARIVGTRFAALLARDDVAVFNALTAQARAREHACSAEVRLQRGDSEIVVRLAASQQPHAPGFLLVAFEDITERRAAEDRLVETERALREANRRKDEFLAMLSHELRNPLAPIRTSLFVMSASEPGSPAASEAREIVERQVDHLTRLVDDLVDVTRISRGKVQLRREPFDVVDLVRCATEDYRAAFDERGIELRLASPTTPIVVDADAARITQVISNLLGNALKFTPAGGHVSVRVERAHKDVELRVRDDGAGITAQLLPHVFEPFTQAPQASDRRHGGLGLGLAMVKALVELHDGSVEITSDGADRGTQVTVRLPTVRARAGTRERSMPQLASRRVLVVEDQDDAARALQTVLTMIGLDVRIASSGPSALAIAREFRPEIVLCDIGLPGMTGHEVARAFRDHPLLSDAYLVALSGYARPEDVERSAAAGFSCHLVKPAAIDTLVQVLANVP